MELFSSITADVISEMRLDIVGLFAQYLIAKATSIIAWPVAAAVEAFKFVFEPLVLRFFIGKLEAIGNWGNDLAEAIKKEIGTP